MQLNRLQLAGGVAGYLAFGIVGQALHPGADAGAWTALAALACVAGAPMFTLPSLLVVHQWVGMPRPPGVVVADLARVAIRGGHLALALAPLLAFFASSGHPDVFRALFATTLAGVVATTLLANMFAIAAGENAKTDGAPVLALCWGALTSTVSLAAWNQLDPL